MKSKVTIATVDNTALASLVFAAVAIAAVSLVAVVSTESLITNNEQVFVTQRVMTSLEAIRLQAMLVETGEQSFVITGKEAELAPYESGIVQIDTEIKYLAAQREHVPLLATNFDALKTAVTGLIEKEKRIVAARKNQGFPAAQALARLPDDDLNHQILLSLSNMMLRDLRAQSDTLEAGQVAYGAWVRRVVLGLILSAALILLFFYSTLHRLHNAQRKAQERMAYLATHDALTGLNNRAAVVEYLDASLANPATAALGGLTVLLLDLDGFKAVNDTLGHDAGDDLLKQVAERMKVVLRDTDFVARLGGDEFLVILPQLSDIALTQRVTEKLVEAIGRPYSLSKRAAEVTVSIGASRFPQDGRERVALMKCADLALYGAKHGGRNQTRFFNLDDQNKQQKLL